MVLIVHLASVGFSDLLPDETDYQHVWANAATGARIFLAPHLPYPSIITLDRPVLFAHSSLD